MLLTMDVGNTNITAGIFVEKDLVELFRITTKLPRTSDEFGILIRDMIAAKGLDTKQISAAIIGSVVPNIMYSLTNGIIKYFDVTPVIVGPGIKTGINLGRLNPREVGADRIVDLVAAYEIYGGPTLVIDYGTATTYDVVTEDGVFLAGVTARASEPLPMHYGRERQDFRRSRSRRRRVSLPQIRSQACRRDLCTE